MEKIFTPDTKMVTGAGEVLTLEEAVQRTKNFIGDHEEFTIEVGSDSHNRDVTRVITAVVIHKIGKGGIFFHKATTYPKMKSLRDKIYTETALSVECAQVLYEIFMDNDMFYTITIHSDIGHNGKTKDLIKEITGYVVAFGFDCYIKPDSIAASIIADKYSK